MAHKEYLTMTMSASSILARASVSVAFAFALLAFGAGCNDDGDSITPAKVCQDYLACAAKVTPQGYPALLDSYGPAGTCWKQTEAIASQCATACDLAMRDIQLLPNLPPECNYTPPPDGGAADAGAPSDAAPRPDLPKPTPGQPVDVLLVIDNSGSMEQEQEELLKEIGKLVEGLRDGTGKLPSLRIGVITTDLGAGNYSLPSCEVTLGDQGKLQNAPRIAGCSGPNNPWIQFEENVAINVSGASPTVSALRDTINCIGRVGIQGCGFEFTLESARRAVDPVSNINPGFLRQGAALLVVFISDEDDCSARNPQLFDPQQQGMSDPLGPLTSFRCFEFGIKCDINDRDTVGDRKNCKPAYDWLYPVDDYIAFFAGLGRPVAMAGILGPRSPVTVGKDGNNPVLKPSCQGANGVGVPAIRIHTLIDAFKGVTGSVCEPPQFGKLLTAAGKQFAQ
jgi:hypothetical protein